MGFVVAVAALVLAVEHGAHHVPTMRADHAGATFEVPAGAPGGQAGRDAVAPSERLRIQQAETAVAADDLSFCAATVAGSDAQLCEVLVDVGYFGRASRDDRRVVLGWLRGHGYRHVAGHLVARLGRDLYLGRGEVAPRVAGSPPRAGRRPAPSRFLLLSRGVSYESRLQVSVWAEPAGTRRLPSEAGYGPPLPVYRVTAFGHAVEGVLAGPAGQHRSVAARLALDTLVAPGV